MSEEMEEDHGGKRRREDQDEPQRHEVLWFTDGNVVLATDKYLFKVFKGILSMHSSVFKDMFELPGVGESSGEQSVGGGNVQEMYDGVPLVTLLGDKGEDVAHLLRALYEHSYYNCYEDNTPLDVVIALLVLGSKYDFKDLKKDVVKQISRQFPMSLREMDLFMADEPDIFGKDRCEAGVSLLQATYKIGVDPLLPILFYCCSNMYMVLLIKETQSMSRELLDILIKGREDLIFAAAELISDLPDLLNKDIGNTECLDDEPCTNKARYRDLYDLHNPYFHYTEGPDVVKGSLIHVCKNCGSSVAKAIDERREEIWKDIPRYFGYLGWDSTKAKLSELISS